MTKQEIRKYAEEKNLPPKIINDLIKKFDSMGIESLNEFDSILLCAEIDREASFWKSAKKIIDKNREERNERNKRQ